MNRLLRCAVPAAALALAAAGVTAYLIAPGKATKEQKAPFLGANIAHRGLHRADRSVPENSLSAFTAAVERGYGVELDVHLTADGRLAVFHDDGLLRMCGVPEKLEDLTYAELRKLRLAGQDEHIPLLGEVLSTVGGRTPIILELKRGHDNRTLCERVYELIRPYSGDLCVESFDPRIVRWFRRHAPEVLRGQLSGPAQSYGRDVARPTAFVLSRLLTNFLGRPQFIAYRICRRKPLTVRLCEAMGAMRVAWTSHSRASETENDTVIFEHYLPERKFR
jgi:glycerophosphoryl diester phosphodiesterase